MGKDTAYCQGCHENFYNGHNDMGIERCWMLKSAKKVTRYRIGWWTSPLAPGAFTEVETYSCHRATGNYQDREFDELPDEVKATFAR